MQNDENWDDPSIKEYTDLQKYAFITQRALDNNHIGYCYRENSEIKIDSGWRLIYGDEDEDYLDNPTNIVTQDLKDLVVLYPALKEIISFKQGSEFEWDDDKLAYNRI